TGKPKGVMVEHRNVNNLVTGLRERIYRNYSGTLNVSLMASYGFDASVQQIFGALLQGHTLHIVPEETRSDAQQLVGFYKKNQIEISDGTPTHIRLLLETHDREIETLPVKHYIIGGEAFPRESAEAMLEQFKRAPRKITPKITNVYGPTECCVDSTSCDITPETLETYEEIPIGTPLPNQQVYILDSRSRMQPIGVWGELCIGGDGVSRGYLKRETLTGEKFPASPFREEQRIYKTGDIARWYPDGKLEYSGRKDHQVKIRGYRIELKDIEAQLSKHYEIKETVVQARKDEDGDNYLCAYIVYDKEETVTAGDLCKYLANSLPDYMIPTFFVPLEKIPLTPGGKLDRKALPEPAKTSGAGYISPVSPVQRELAGIWSEILKVDSSSVGITDNFFQLGGHSLKA
ncbi:MAG: AMP-binding protein, partial [bacterium]|nr:AMP-binding protein [bacterium]